MKRKWGQIYFLLFVMAVLVTPSYALDVYRWNIKGTVILEDGSAFAVIENERDRTVRLIQVGDTLDDGKVTRIERDRVVIILGDQEVVLQTGFQDGSGSPSAASAVSRGGTSQTLPPHPHLPVSPPVSKQNQTRAMTYNQEENDFKNLLTHEIMNLSRNPVPLSAEEHGLFIKDLSAAVSERNLVPQSGAYIKEDQERKITGMVAASDIQSMGISRGDLLIHINGIFLNSENRWGDVLSAVKDANLVTFSYLRGTEIHSQVLKKN